MEVMTQILVHKFPLFDSRQRGNNWMKRRSSLRTALIIKSKNIPMKVPQSGLQAISRKSYSRRTTQRIYNSILEELQAARKEELSNYTGRALLPILRKMTEGNFH